MDDTNPASGFFKSLKANSFNTAIMTLIGLVIPAFLGSTEYGYWQVIALYLIYIPYFHLGWVDGVYLQEGGKSWEDVDCTELHTQFLLYVIFVGIISVLWVAVSFFLSDPSYRTVLRIVAIECMLTLPRVFLQYLFQATGRVGEYAHNLKMERTLCAALQVLALGLGMRSFEAIAFGDMIAKAVTLVSIVRLCPSFFRSGFRFDGALKRTASLMRAGGKLTFSTVSALLLVGIIQFSIQFNWSIEQFGMVSFALVATNGAVYFINQVAVVLFPILQRQKSGGYERFYQAAGIFVSHYAFKVLLIYYPLSLILSLFLPGFGFSIRCIGVLLPIALIEGRCNLVLNTLLKAQRREKLMMQVNLVMIMISGLFTFITVYVLHNLWLVVASITVLFGIRALLTDLIVHRCCRVSSWREAGFTLFYCAVYLLLCVQFSTWWSYLVFVGFVAAVSTLRKESRNRAMAFISSASS